MKFGCVNGNFGAGFIKFDRFFWNLQYIPTQRLMLKEVD